MAEAKEEKCPYNPLCDMAVTKFEELSRYMELLHKATERTMEARFLALQTSLDKAEATLDVRLESMNEFRKQIEKERLDYITRRETVLLNFIISVVVVIVAAGVGLFVSKL